MSDGRLAIILHTHMPYVEGFGTWPFGEEWLWEAVATSYLPLLEVLDERVTLSLTPVLADQLEAPGAIERCLEFLSTVRPASHDLDREHYAEDSAAVAELERSAAEYAAAASALAAVSARPGGLLAALGEHARWTSSATHAILPLLCFDESVELQLTVGIDSHRRRFGAWEGGLWLPECAYAPRLDPLLEDAGVHHVCVELADVELGRPLQTGAGPLLWPIDRPVIDLVWGRDGYPSQGAYRAYRRRTPRDHQIWTNDGAIYSAERAEQQLRADAADFVAHVLGLGRLSVFAIDTELLGHWWYEGPRWLAAVLAEAGRQGLELVRLEHAGLEPRPVPPLGHSSWGEGGDLRTWSTGAATDLAWGLRSAELRALGAGRRPSPRALRELLALQSSDWAFLEYHGWAGGYGRRRHDGHLAALESALHGELDDEPALRGLAPVL